MRIEKLACILVLLAFLRAGAAWGQETMGTISGAVKDSSGAILPGSKITVLNDGTGISRIVTSSDSGSYTVPLLSLGNYRVTASHEGFKTEIRQGIVLTVGREAIIDFSLAVGTVTQEVEVTGEAPLVEATTGSLGALVDDRTMQALPLNGRSYDQLAELQPGVTRSSPGVFSNTSYTYGSGERFSVGGQRTYTNSFLMDGTNINDQGNGTPGGANGLNLGMDTMQEFKIFTSSYKAEYGYSTGSVTSVATRSGTNSIHGTAFEYIRNSVLDTRNYFDTSSTVPPFRRNQFGGSFGGPIIKDKTFFFAGYEGLRQGQENTQIATVPTALARQGMLPYGTYPVSPAIVPYLDLYPLPNGRDYGDGTAQFISSPNQISNGTNVMGRVDHQFNAKLGVFARYILDQDVLNIPLNIPGEFADSSSRRQYFTSQANSVLSQDLFNNFRFAFNRTRSGYNELFLPANDPANQLSFVPGQPIGAINVGGGTQAGVSRTIAVMGFASGNGNIDWAFNIFELADDLTRVSGKHTLRFGIDFQRMQDNYSQPSQLRGTYTFTNLTTFLAATPSVFQADSPFGANPQWGLRQFLYGLYAQDDWKVSHRLSVNLGFRWEATTDPIDANGRMAILPSIASTSTVRSSNFLTVGKLNFEPRLGMAWQMDNAGKTVFRLGGGIYHNLIYPWLYSQYTQVPPYFSILSENNPTFPNGYTTLNSGLVALKIESPQEKTPTAYQFNSSFQREIFNHTVLQVDYAGNVGNHLQMGRETDTATPTFCSSANNCPAGIPNGDVYYPAGAPRLNPAWAGERVYYNEANSSYNSGTVTVRRQFSLGIEGEFFYTYSKALDLITAVNTADSQRSGNAIMNPWNPKVDWGLSDYNSKNDFGFNATLPSPLHVDSRAFGPLVNHWTFDVLGTFDSGLPFTGRLTTGVSRDDSSILVERPNLNTGFSNNPSHGTTGAGCTGIPAGQRLGGATMYFNPCAFSNPTAGTYGDLGRNTIVGPPLKDLDLALEKIFKPTEKLNVTFRAEAFNSLNYANFGLPSVSALNAQGAPNASAGVITYTITSSRQLQFALRFGF